MCRETLQVRASFGELPFYVRTRSVRGTAIPLPALTLLSMRLRGGTSLPGGRRVG
jgi:hypothetical protein